MNNEAGVACLPKSRAALRLETFEARPEATEGPSDRGKVEPFRALDSSRANGETPSRADNGSLVLVGVRESELGGQAADASQAPRRPQRQKAMQALFWPGNEKNEVDEIGQSRRLLIGFLWELSMETLGAQPS